MYGTPSTVGYLSWHASNKSNDAKMQGPVDYPSWEHIWAHHLDFEDDARNLHFSMVVDGVNPYSMKRFTSSFLALSFFNMYLALWLTINKHFIFLSLLVMGSNSITREDTNIFLTPLVAQLLEYRTHGMRFYDVVCFHGETWFVARIIPMWCI